jgi:hypothetical protein
MENLTLPGVFELLDYSLSHSILLYRKMEWIDDAHFNTDIFFSSTYYIEAPTKLYNLTIKQGSKKDCDYISDKIGKSHYVIPISPESVYVIISRRKKYYIGAILLTVTKNNYKEGETSIGLKRS